jgi:hypothetical protein
VSDKKPHWRTVDDIRGYVGDRIVADLSVERAT